jgi:N-acetyl-gamma-glutamyl-phosphate reductase
MKTVAVIGARGYTGRELLTLLDGHPHVEVVAACSAAAAGRRVSDEVEGFSSSLTFTAPSPEVLDGVDAAFLALPNGTSAPYVEAAADATVLIDLSADHRFDERWAYGLPEHHRATLEGARRVANPGCYATGAQVGLRPFIALAAAPPAVFGVSGYSGAGTTPSRKNDPAVLADNLLPYALVEHVHEREISRHLDHPVAFHPHVASFFRGISLTLSLELREAAPLAVLQERLERAYRDEPFVEVLPAGLIPEVKDVVGSHGVRVGGLAVHERRVVLVATLDNLLKGAASQAVQNLNLSLGFSEAIGLRTIK